MDEKDFGGVNGGVTGIWGENGIVSIASRLVQKGVAVMVNVFVVLLLCKTILQGVVSCEKNGKTSLKRRRWISPTESCCTNTVNHHGPKRRNDISLLTVKDLSEMAFCIANPI